ncbi:MAG TPA: DUF255 domain-containing protein [Candidatus Acidoferrales bacterium]|nr:DUF255 domain-containing protein [Candidatus Acidoferrales bacterium]
MKTKLTTTLATVLILFAALVSTPAAEPKPVYSATAASDVLAAACQQAAKESKLVFLKSGYPECSWCRVFDKFHGKPEVQKIIGKYYVVAVIDWEDMPDGKAVFGQYAKIGAPSWVILTPDKKVIIDSYAPSGNVGFPGAPDETKYYLAALKKATPAITADELQILSDQIQKAMQK